MASSGTNLLKSVTSTTQAEQPGAVPTFELLDSTESGAVQVTDTAASAGP